MKDSTIRGDKVLVLGIGNVLMGDEGVGVHVVRYLESLPLPADVVCCDGGTGSFALLQPMQEAARIILIDATADGMPTGTFRRLEPRFSKEYPPTLTAHDIGLKDLLDVFHLMGRTVPVALYAISIDMPQGLGLELSPAVARCVPEVARAVLAEVGAAQANVGFAGRQGRAGPLPSHADGEYAEGCHAQECNRVSGHPREDPR